MSAPLLRTIACIMIVLFGTDTLFAPVGYAQVAFLPAAGTMVPMTGKFNPVVIKGMQLYPDNPFKFDFIVDTGDTTLSQEQLKEQGQKLIAYFLASLTTPEKDMWVNLSPYEKDRIIPTAFGDTQMGKELLSQDYLLKQIMATALYPQRELGRQFWQKVYSEAQLRFGTTNVPVNTFNKVWILPDKALVYENSRMNSVFVVESSLKVMLEQDYLATKKNANVIPAEAGIQDTSALGPQIIREIIIPALQKEVNEGKNFAPLRQVYQSLILAAWYKKNLKDNVIAQAYVDRNKTKGVDVADKNITQKIYKQYLQAYRKGVYNFIKEDIDAATQAEVPRKYFSGGETFEFINKAMAVTFDPAKAATLLENTRRLLRMSTEAKLAGITPIQIRPSPKNDLPPIKGPLESIPHPTKIIVVVALAGALVGSAVGSGVATDVANSVVINVATRALGAAIILGYTVDAGNYYVKQAYYRVLGGNPAAVKAATRYEKWLTKKEFDDRWKGIEMRPTPPPMGLEYFREQSKKGPLLQPRPPQAPQVPKPNTKSAAYGGINLEKVNVNTRGGGVRTAFSDPEQLKMLLNADGLVPVIYKIQPLTVAMMNMLLGISSP